jgi:hypothetical protein
MPVTVAMIRNLFKKDFPKLITKEVYQKPRYRPTKWAILHGPSYGEKKFRATLLIDLSQMREWAINHAKQTWTNQTYEQSAKEYFPEWLERIDLETDAVTVLDKGQYGFLKDYYLDFVNKDWHQIYCPDCKKIYKNIDIKDSNRNQEGKNISWSIDWRCIEGHILYAHEQSIRIF